MKMITTGKGRKYSNVFFESGNVYVLGKRTGKLHQSPVITGTPEHTIAGHERLECYTCHSRAVPQCYGCHTRYDRTKFGKDYIKNIKTKGNTVSWDMICDSPEGKMKSSGKITYQGDRFNGIVMTDIPGQGQMKMTMNGRHIGKCNK